ncbi:MAG: hypothetical protein ACRDTH_24430 [Pseudonocardiaceae bacterium]
MRARVRAQFGRGEPVDRPQWPMLVLRTPKGWTGPRDPVDVTAHGGGPANSTAVLGRW